MSDVELSPTEEAKLRDLLGQAGAGLSVETPDDLGALVEGASSGHGEPPNPDPAMVVALSPARQPRLQLAAAAMVVVAMAIGAGWWMMRGDDTRTVATASDGDQTVPGVPESSDNKSLVDADALAPGGIWRLPDDSKFEVYAAEVAPSMSMVQTAVDDVDDPTRWFAMLVSYPLVEPDNVVATDTVGLDNSMVAEHLRLEGPNPTGSKWIRLTQPGAAISLTFAYSDVSDSEVMSSMKAIATAVSDLNDFESVRPVLRDLPLPDGLTPTWDSTRMIYPDLDDITNSQVIIGLRDLETGDKFAAFISDTGLSPSVARLEQLLTGQVFPYNPAQEDEVPVIDLVPNGLRMKTSKGETLVPFTEGGIGMRVYADQGPDDWVHEIVIAEDDLDEASQAPGEQGTPQDMGAPVFKIVSMADQIRVINTLRPVSEAEFRAKMKAEGIDIYE